MASLLKSTRNTRPVLPGSLRFLRSDVPVRLTVEEIDWLLTNQIRTVVDLRTAEESRQKPCPLASDARFAYHHLPVTGGNAVPSCTDAVAESYIRMVDSQMQHIFSFLQSASTNVLLFCNAGKDRTGVVSALLQKSFGLSDAEIVEDYLRSGDNLRDLLEAYAKINPAVDLQVITPKREYMERFLSWYESKH